MKRCLASFVLVVFLVTAAAASDLVSVVKPNRSADAGSLLTVPAGTRWSATNVTVRALVSAAYGAMLPLRDEQIVGLPAWAGRDRFDIEVRVVDGEAFPGEPDDDSAVTRAFGLVRTLLAERFG